MLAGAEQGRREAGDIPFHPQLPHGINDRTDTDIETEPYRGDIKGFH